MRLINTKTGAPVAKGDTVINFRGEPATLTGWREPAHSGSTGRVIIKRNGSESEAYPGVYDLKFEE